MRQNAIRTEKHRCGTRFRKRVITNPLSSQNDAKRNLRENVVLALDLETVITNTAYTQNDAKRNLSQKVRSFSQDI